MVFVYRKRYDGRMRKKRPPGRPRLGGEDDDTKRLAVDVPESELDSYRQAASDSGMTLSAWVRATLGREVKRLLRRTKRG